jgi:hypothetical protein
MIEAQRIPQRGIDSQVAAELQVNRIRDFLIMHYRVNQRDAHPSSWLKARMLGMVAWPTPMVEIWSDSTSRIRCPATWPPPSSSRPCRRPR